MTPFKQPEFLSWRSIRERFPEMARWHCFSWISNRTIEQRLRDQQFVDVRLHGSKAPRDHACHIATLVQILRSTDYQPLDPIVLLREPTINYLARLPSRFADCRLGGRTVWVFDGNHRARAYSFAAYNRKLPFYLAESEPEAQSIVYALRNYETAQHVERLLSNPYRGCTGKEQRNSGKAIYTNSSSRVASVCYSTTQTQSCRLDT